MPCFSAHNPSMVLCSREVGLLYPVMGPWPWTQLPTFQQQTKCATLALLLPYATLPICPSQPSGYQSPILGRLFSSLPGDFHARKAAHPHLPPSFSPETTHHHVVRLHTVDSKGCPLPSIQCGEMVWSQLVPSRPLKPNHPQRLTVTH